MKSQTLLSIFVLIVFQIILTYCEPFNQSSSLYLENCTTSSDCPADQSCDFDTKKCLCNFGFKLNNASQCEPFNCSSIQNCTDNFGPYSECKNGKCACYDTFSLDPENQQCNKRIGNKCKTDFECGVNAGCYGEKEKICRCKFNNYVNSDLFNCDQLACIDDRRCVFHFGKLTHCRKPTNPNIPAKCGCPSPVGYVFDNELQTCITQNITKECSVTSDCGPHSVCLNSTCSCQFGYVFNETGGCRALHCLNDNECLQAFPHSLCTRKLNCECNEEHFELDSGRMICVEKKGAFIKYVLASTVVLMVLAPILWFLVQNFFKS